MALSVVQTTGQAPVQSGTVSFTLSSASTVGNILVAFCAYSQYSNSRTITTPSGWTKIDDNSGSSTSGNLDTLAVFWTTVGTGATTYSFTISDAGDNTAGALYEITGADTTTPINAHPHASVLGPVTTVASPSATPSVIGTLALVGMTLDNAGDVDGYGSISAGWTANYENVSNYHLIVTGSKTALTTDTTTAISASITMTGSQSSDGGIIETVLIAPSTGGTTTTTTVAPVTTPKTLALMGVGR